MAKMPKDMRRAIGERLKRAREAANLTQQDVATDFERTRQAISSWENGITLPTLLVFRSLATLYGVSSDVILYGADVGGEGIAALRRAQRQGEALPG